MLKVFVVWLDGSCSNLKGSEFSRVLSDENLWVCRLYKNRKEIFSRVRSFMDDGNILVEDNDNGNIIKFYE